MSDDPYASERYHPEDRYIPPARGGAQLRFNGSVLFLAMPGGEVRSYPATSGKGTTYDPIPEGRFWVNPTEFASIGIRKPWWTASRIINQGDSPGEAWEWAEKQEEAWGSWRLPIHPFPDTDTTDAGGRVRGGFFIHGGTEPGSAGCIDLTLRMDAFRDDLLSASVRIPGAPPLPCWFELTVTYPSTAYPATPLQE